VLEMVQELNLQSNLISEYRTEIIYDPSMILTHMQIGTSLPILPGFENYILDAIKYYNSRSILLHEHVQNSGTKHVKGFMLVYDDNEDDTLYFGFCGVSDHDPEGIQCLIDELIIHAYENGYSSIKGPINVPTVIFGFGFMKDGSNDSQFIGCPANPPIYQQVFKKNGFEVVIEEFRFKMPALKMNLDNLEGYDFTEFEFINPGEENIWEVLPEIKQLHHRRE